MRKVSKIKQHLSFMQIIRKTIRAFLVTSLLFLVLFFIWAFQSGLIQKKTEEITKTFHHTLENLGFELSSEILIHGRERTDLSEIQKALDIPQNRLITNLDLKRMQERLKALPWVKEALVVRQLPDMLKIDLIERKPIVLWQKGNSYYPVDEEGVVIPVLDEENVEELIILVGEKAAAAAPELIKNLEKYPDLMERVMGAKYIDERRWSLYIDDLKNGILIDLPDSDLSVSLKRLNKLQSEKKVLEKQIKHLDLRFEDKVVIVPISKDSILLPSQEKEKRK